MGGGNGEKRRGVGLGLVSEVGGLFKGEVRVGKVEEGGVVGWVGVEGELR